MNIKEYLSTGILEAYLLGDLPKPERIELERNVVLYPELKAELTLVQEANERFLITVSIQPGFLVQEKLFNRIDLLANQHNLLPISRVHISPVWRYAAAASIAIAIVSSYMAYTYWDRWKEVSSKLTQLVAQNEQVARDYNQVFADLGLHARKFLHSFYGRPFSRRKV